MDFKNTYTNVPLTKCRASLKKEFPHISSVSVKKLLPLPSTYLRETSFSKYTLTKTKRRSRSNAEEDLGIWLSKISLHYFNSLVARSQTHTSPSDKYTRKVFPTTPSGVNLTFCTQRCKLNASTCEQNFVSSIP